MIVRAVPSRMRYVEYLQRHLPGLEVCMDSNCDAMQNFKAAMDLAGDDACLHLEDDAILTEDFLGKIEKAIAKQACVHQFFSRRKEDLATGSRFDAGRKFTFTLCFYLPPGYSKAVSDYMPTWRRIGEHPTGFDYLVADFLGDRKERYYINVPSLVQHRECVSAIDSRRSKKRQAPTFIDEAPDVS